MPRKDDLLPLLCLLFTGPGLRGLGERNRVFPTDGLWTLLPPFKKVGPSISRARFADYFNLEVPNSALRKSWLVLSAPVFLLQRNSRRGYKEGGVLPNVVGVPSTMTDLG